MQISIPPSSPPLDDETAVDMLTFAMSGPGIIALASFISLSIVVFLSFYELGPFFTKKKTSNMPLRPFMLRIQLDKPVKVEFAEESMVRSISRGESIFKFSSLEALNAVACQLRPVKGAKFSAFRLDGMSVRTLVNWPSDINVQGAKWMDNKVNQREKGVVEKDLQVVWDEYERIDAFTEVDKEWMDYVKKLDGLLIDSDDDGNECKLCGGSGYTRCFRCGGVTSDGKGIKNKSFSCDCKNGRRPCEWCSSTS